MNVLVVTNDFPPRVGGINDYVAQLVSRFEPGEVTVFASTWPGAATFDASFPQRVVRWPVSMLLPTPRTFAAVARLIRDQSPDALVFGAAMPLALLGPPLLRRFGVPYVACTHGLEFAATRIPGGGPVLGRIAHSAAMVTTVSHYVRDALAPFVGPKTPVEMVPSGVDVDRFTPQVSTEGLRARYALGEGPVIGCVSRLVPRKGQDQLIRMLPAVVAEWPGARLLIVGRGPDEQRLRRLARAHGVQHQVVFTGEVPYAELPAHFRVGDVFAMPCRDRFFGLETEGLGAVYLQAAAVGRPCIAGNAGGAPEAVRAGETGLVVDGTRTDDILGAVRTLLRAPERAEAMGMAGAQWIRTTWTWDYVAARFRALLAERVIGRGPVGTSSSTRQA